MTDPVTETQPAPKRRARPVKLIILALLVSAAFVLGYYIAFVQKPLADNQQLNEELVTRTVGLTDPRPLRMDEGLQDANDDGIADAPHNPDAQLDPPSLTFSYVAIEDPEKYRAVFAEFVQHLSKSLGKPVEYSTFKNPALEIRAMREGKLHAAGFNTGNVPLAVITAGFVPVCRLATADGGGMYQM